MARGFFIPHHQRLKRKRCTLVDMLILLDCDHI